MIATAAFAGSSFKLWVERAVGIAPDVLHAFAGVLLLLLFHLLVRRQSLRWPWFGVLILELINEALDMSRPAGAMEKDMTASLLDLFITLFLPSVLVLLWPLLLGTGPRERSERPLPLVEADRAEAAR